MGKFIKDSFQVAYLKVFLPEDGRTEGVPSIVGSELSKWDDDEGNANNLNQIKLESLSLLHFLILQSVGHLVLLSVTSWWSGPELDGQSFSSLPWNDRCPSFVP